MQFRHILFPHKKCVTENKGKKYFHRLYAHSCNNFRCQYPLISYPISVFTPISKLVQLRKFATIRHCFNIFNEKPLW